MSERPALLDVSVPMYAAGGDHPYQAPCAWVMTEVAEGRLSVAIDTESIQEVLYRYGHLGRLDVAAGMAEGLLDLVPIVLPVRREDARRAVKLFVRYAPEGIPARDVLHVAVMRGNGLDEIISTDHHFDPIEGIRRLDPRALYGDSGPG